MGSGEIAKEFLRLGMLGFGGPAAHLAMMHERFVHQLGWMSDEEFQETLAVTNLVPGPNSTEMAMHIGRHRGGTRGLYLAGGLFILPAFLMVLALAFLYVEFQSLPRMAGALVGLQAVAIALLAHVTWNLSRTSFPNMGLWSVGLASAFLAILGVHPLVPLLGFGLLWAWSRKGHALGLILPVATGHAVWSLPMLAGLGWVFLQIGGSLYGSGYVLLNYLQVELVDARGWVTEQQLLDAVSIGQITPGPVFTTATFLGYLVGGWSGALVATVAIFLPGFLFVQFTGAWLERLRSTAGGKQFLQAVAAVAVGLLVAILVILARSTWGSGSVAIASVVALLLLRLGVPSVAVLASGALVGALGLL